MRCVWYKFEKFQSSRRPIRKCPKCGKNKVRRLISTGAGLIFKGSGFYTTDYPLGVLQGEGQVRIRRQTGYLQDTSRQN